MKKICGNCTFWISDSELQPVTLGDCRRFPPTVSEKSEFWPETMSDEWCGEFEAAKDRHPVFHEGVGIYDATNKLPAPERPDDLLAREIINRIVEFNEILQEHHLDPLTGLSFSPRTWNALLAAPGFPMNIYASEKYPKSVCGVPIHVAKKIP